MKRSRHLLPQILFSAVFILCFFAVLVLLVLKGEVQMSDRVFGVVRDAMMMLTALIPVILQFWIGSSSGSKEKDAQKQEPEQRG